MEHQDSGMSDVYSSEFGESTKRDGRPGGDQSYFSSPKNEDGKKREI